MPESRKNSKPGKCYSKPQTPKNPLHAVLGGRFGKLIGELEMRIMPRIREENEPRIGKPLLKDERIHGRHHDVVVTVHHESPVSDVLQRAIALTSHLTPLRECGQLGSGDLRRCGRFPIHLPRADASEPCLARGLASGGG